MKTDLEVEFLIAERKNERCEKFYDISMGILVVVAFTGVITVMILISINYFER
jgi:hypothetical protein